MKKNVVWLCIIGAVWHMPLYAGIAEDLDSAMQDVSYDFTEISKWVNNELTEGLAYTAGSGNIQPAEIIKFPGFEFGVSVGATRWPLDVEGFRSLNLHTIDTSSTDNKIDMPNTIGMPDAIGHVKIALPFDFDIGGRYGSYAYDVTEGNAKLDFENTVWGVEVRRRLLGGEWSNIFLPDISLNVSYDTLQGNIGRTESYSDYTRTEVYDGTSYKQDIVSETTWNTEWNVHNIGVKTIVSKTFLFITPMVGLGINKHTGSTKTKIINTGRISLESSFFSLAESLALVNQTKIDAQDITIRLLAGFELSLLMLKLGFSGEFSGDYQSYHAGLRFQFR